MVVFKRMEYPDKGMYRYQKVRIVEKLTPSDDDWPAWGNDGDDIYLIEYLEDSPLTGAGEIDYAREEELAHERKTAHPM